MVDSQGSCDNCNCQFSHLPAAIVVPSRDACIGLYGCYCSWNCAKRGLFGLRTRPWYALLSITAIKTGAKLPIKISPLGRPPDKKDRQIVCRIPFLSVIRVKSIGIKYLPLPACQLSSSISSDIETEPEPEVFESIIQASFEI